MADVAKVRNYLTGTLAFTAETAQAVTDAGLDSFNVIRDFPAEEIEKLCAVLRHPGGTIANPAHAGNNALPATIPNPGIAINLVQQKKLRLLGFLLRHCNQTQRPEDAATAMEARVNSMHIVMVKEKETKGEDAPLPNKLESGEGQEDNRRHRLIPP